MFKPFCRFRPHLAAVGAVAVTLGMLAVRGDAADGWPACGPAMRATEVRIQAALQEGTQIEFIETPLSDVVGFLSDMHDIPIGLDIRAMDDAGISADAPVTKNIRGIALDSALQHLLDDLEMTFVIHHEILLLTTEDAAAGYAVLRVYDVARLIGDGPDAAGLAAALTQVLQGVATHPAADAAMSGYGAEYGGGYEDEGYSSYGGQEDYGSGCGQDGYGMGAGDTPRESGRKGLADRLPQVAPYRHLLIVRDTTRGHRRFSELLGAMARGLGCPPE